MSPEKDKAKSSKAVRGLQQDVAKDSLQFPKNDASKSANKKSNSKRVDFAEENCFNGISSSQSCGCQQSCQEED